VTDRAGPRSARATTASSTSNAERQLKPGATFGRYIIVRPIGSGGMAAVYQARHVDLQKSVALKVLHPFLALRIDVVQRFVLEARAASRFAHPHVVDISDIGSQDGVPFIAMDLLEGEQLAAILDRDGPLPVERLADVLVPVVSAVAAAHDAGVLHRDLKPDNVFLARRRRGEHPVLLDFGISKVDSGGPAQPLTAAGDLLGTPPYMSPEQVEHGMGRFDARSDQYALGVILYECATGRLPYRDHASIVQLMTAIARGGAPPPSSIRPEIPPDFDALVARAMNLDPALRYPSVLGLGRALLAFASPRARALWADEFGDDASPRPDLRETSVVVSPADLAVIPLLAEAPAEELAAFAALAPARRYRGGVALFEQGTPAASCLFVLSGTADLSRTWAADTWVVGAASAGTVLGLSALWLDGTRPVSAVAREDVVALELPRAALDALGATCPTLADRLHDEAAAVSARRLKGATDRALELIDRSSDLSREPLVRLSAATQEWTLALPNRTRR
jgi:serine/threonine-protein kinase